LVDYNKILAGSAFVDTETTQLSSNTGGLFEVSVGHRDPSGQIREAFSTLVQPWVLKSGKPVNPIRRQDVSAWSKNVLNRDGLTLSHLNKKGMHPTERGRLWGGVHRAIKGRNVFVQNLNFESGFFAELMTDPQYERLTHSMPMSPTGTPYKQHRIFTTSDAVDKAKNLAFGEQLKGPEKFTKAWADVYGVIRGELQRPDMSGMTRFWDVQDITRSMFGLAQQKGVMKMTGDVFTGTAADVYSRLWEGKEEVHRGMKDVRLESRMAQTHLEISEKLDTGVALSKREHAYLGAIDYLKPSIQRQNALKSIAQAYSDVNYGEGEEKGWRRVTNRGPLYTKAHQRTTPGGVATEVDKIVAGGITEKTYVTNFDDAVRFMAEDRPGQDYSSLKDVFQEKVAKPHEAWVKGGGSASQAKAHLDDLIFKEIDQKARAGILPPSEYVEALKYGERDYNWGGAKKVGRTIKSNWKPILGGLGGLWLLSKIAGRDDDYNTIEGMPHGWFGAERTYDTDFGSGYQGIKIQIAQALYNSTISMGTSTRVPEGKNLYYLPLDKSNLTVEDADTVNYEMANGSIRQFRLEGVDAPEIEHEEEYAAGRIRGDQPYGQKAKSRLQSLISSQSQVGILVDPSQATYGRSIGVLLGDDQQDLNLQLLESGSAAYLPYGKSSDSLINRSVYKRAAEQAFLNQEGMFADDSWRIKRLLDPKGKITNVTLTDPQRLAENFKAASILRRMRHQDQDASDMQVAGGKDDFNIIEGMRHGWFGAQRKFNTDFGSGFLTYLERTSNVVSKDLLKKFVKSLGVRVEHSAAKAKALEIDWRVEGLRHNMRTVFKNPNVPIRTKEALRQHLKASWKDRVFGVREDILSRTSYSFDIRKKLLLAPEDVKSTFGNESISLNLLAHEVFEAHHGLRLTKEGMQQKFVQDRVRKTLFGSHFSPAVVADEALFSLHTGTFEQMKAARFEELDRIPDYIKETKKELESYAPGSLGREMTEMDLKKVEGYAERTRTIYRRVQERARKNPNFINDAYQKRANAQVKEMMSRENTIGHSKHPNKSGSSRMVQ